MTLAVLQRMQGRWHAAETVGQVLTSCWASPATLWKPGLRAWNGLDVSPGSRLAVCNSCKLEKPKYGGTQL